MPSFSHRIPGSQTPNALAAALAARRAAGLPIINMVDSNPSRVGFERSTGPLLNPLSKPEDAFYNPDPHGLPGPREALSAFYSYRMRPSDLFLCASTSEAYGWLFKLLCEPGEAVLVPKPGYPLFDFLAGLECVEARPYSLEYIHPSGWRIDLDSLEEGLRAGKARAVVLINPNNPTGSYVRGEEREEVVRLASKYGAALIVDEVFLGFPVEEADLLAGQTCPPQSSVAGSAAAGLPDSLALPSFLGEERVLCFVLNGLSKLLGLPQTKLGWISVSGPAGDVRAAGSRLEIISDTYLSAGTPVQNALPDYLSLAPDFARLAGARIRRNMSRLREVLETRDSPHRVLYCGGGWTALLEAPRIDPEEDIALALLSECGISVQPGYYFDMPHEAYFSMSLIVEPSVFDEGLARYRAYFDKRLAD